MAAPSPRRRSTALQSFSLRKTSDVDILLDDETDTSFVSSYSTMDRISGRVIVRCPKDTSFKSLEISFEGITDTFIEKVATTAATSGRSTGKHRFLKLIQPVDAALFPDDMVAKAGVPYDFPFEFVVPDQLLDQNCTHPVDSPDVHEAHLQVPPSFGDPMLAGDGVSLRDDLAPEMTKIQYIIRARVLKAAATGAKSLVVADKAIKVRIVPARAEDPPLSISPDNSDYEMRAEKHVRKGLFQGKIGRIVAEAPQPSSFRLPALKNRSASPISTMTTVHLRFDPVCDSTPPPPLNSLSSKLRVQTFFGSVPFRRLPTRGTLNLWDTQRGSYMQSVDLSSRCVANVEWERHSGNSEPSSPSPTRRESYFSSLSNGSTTAPSKNYRESSPYYTATVLVPLALPHSKSFAPTFHSCSVSRTYRLDMTLSYHTPGTSVGAPSLTLKLPIQISSEANPNAQSPFSLTEAEAIAMREVDEEFGQGVWEARSVAPPAAAPDYHSPEFTRMGMRAPTATRRATEPNTELPGYEAFGRRNLSVAGPGVVAAPPRILEEGGRSIVCS